MYTFFQNSSLPTSITSETPDESKALAQAMKEKVLSFSLFDLNDDTILMADQPTYNFSFSLHF